jgi:death-on-curing protein
VTPRFLTSEEVLRIHRAQLDAFGGLAGVRDVNLLESAVAAAASKFAGEFLHMDLCEMAAAYAFHITKNHPFFDGNKRVGAAAAAMFVELNGWHFIADPDAFVDVSLSLARGEMSKAAVAEFLRANVESI